MLRSFPPGTDALRVLQSASNAIAAAQAELVVEVAERGDHEAEGCSSIKNWLRDQPRLDTAAAHRLVDAGRTLRRLPRVADAADTGALSPEHVHSFSYALRHLDPGIVDDAQDWMIDLAGHAPPKTLRDATVRLREIAYPDELDEAWIRGMNRHDVRLSPVADGWHLTGFLPADTGAAFRAVLGSLSAPTCADDDRPAAERRITALDTLLTGVLENGLPADKGVRPHIDLTVDLAQLTQDPDTTTARLAGFGSIGPAQLQQLLCGGDLTPVLTAGKHATLDVGRRARLATPHQRRAVGHQQDGTCAGPGCHAPVVHVHHIRHWSDGGPTDLTNLIGLCPACHRLVHAGRLRIDPRTRRAEATVRRRSPGRLPDPQRVRTRAVRARAPAATARSG